MNSIDDYARWYREMNEQPRKEQKRWQIYAFWSREMGAKSELYIDEGEQWAWAMANGRWQYDTQMEKGMNPCIPDEGTEFLTEDQAIEKIAREMYLPIFRMTLVSRYLCEKNGFNMVTDADLEDGFQTMLKQCRITEEDYFADIQMEQNEENRKMVLESLREHIPEMRLCNLMEAEAETYMEA